MPANPQGLALYWTVHGRNLKRWHHSLQLYCCPNCGRLAQHAKGGEPSHLAQPQSQSSWPLPQPLDVSVSYSLEGRCSAQRQSSTPPSILNPVDPRSKLAWTQVQVYKTVTAFRTQRNHQLMIDHSKLGHFDSRECISQLLRLKTTGLR